MKNKKIWITLICAFLLICGACAFQVIRQNNQNKYETSLKTVAPVENKDLALQEEQSQQNIIEIDADEKNGLDKEEHEIREQKLEMDKKDDVENNRKKDLVELPDKSIDTADNINNQSTFEINPETGLDKYNTEPVPEGKPLPVEWQNAEIKDDEELTCTLSVSCKTILDNLDNINPDKKEIVPEDGIIFTAQKVTFYEGESVFNILLREMKKNKIHMEFVMTPIYNSNYIEGIANLYEFDCGELSGWMYKVNGWVPNYGCSRYKLKDGDVIEWLFTCDLGRDIGDTFMTGE